MRSTSLDTPTKIFPTNFQVRIGKPGPRIKRIQLPVYLLNLEMRHIRPVVFLFLFFLRVSSQTYGQTPKIDSLKSVLAIAEDTIKVNVLNKLAEAFRSKEPKQSIEYAKAAIDLSRKIDFIKGEIIGLKNLGLSQGVNNDYACIESLKQSSQLAETINDLETIQENSTYIAGAYITMGNNEMAMKYYLQCSKINEQLGNKRGLAIALAGIGNIYTKEKNYAQGLKSLFKSLGYFEDIKEEKEIARSYLNIGMTYKEMKDYDKALGFYEKAMTTYKKLNNRRAIAFVFSDVGEIYMKQGKTDKAIESISQARVLHEEGDYVIELASDFSRLGKIYSSKDQTDRAMEFYVQSIILAKKLSLRELLSETYHDLSHLYGKVGDYKNAYAYQELHILYYDSVFNQEKNKQLVEMQTRFETENKEKEIEILKKNHVINRIYLISVSAGLFFVLLTGFLIINRQRLKARTARELSRREMQISEEQRSLTEAELQNKILREKQLESELEFKNKELTTFTLNLIQKNEILETLKSQIAAIRHSSDDATRSKLGSLMSTVNFSFHLDKDWDNFKLHFQQVHKDFFEKLGKAYSGLSGNDLKVCALLKLNMGTKEMASILDISPESVKAARYRIRKKIGLPSEQTLSSFFNNFHG